ncbi:serine hydroxymethyltransferase [Ligilactobacillus salivarius]|uniref:serine hydroxymethyltransferase n=1 Tax=Ligilactobacillus salivarius TaxID=1624 RepID=UPI003C09FC06
MDFKKLDPELWQAIANEEQRQQNNIELIASENIVSKNVLDAQGSVLTNKYAEGYPGRRYYGGCQFIDVVENLAIDRAKQLFGAKYVNVQPHSGSQANAAAYMSLVEPGDTIMGMDLAAGGHYADITTTTTHKTLRGPRGGMILTNDENLAKKINSNVFPGTQGGPLEHVIAGKAAAFGEALTPEFKEYGEQIIRNTQEMALCFADNEKARLVSNGSDNHLLLLDVRNFGLNGKEAEKLLDQVNITVNKNSIPFETLSPFKTSGIRIGTPAITSRGFNEEDSYQVAKLILTVLENKDDKQVLADVKRQVKELTDAHPIYAEDSIR